MKARYCTESTPSSIQLNSGQLTTLHKSFFVFYWALRVIHFPASCSYSIPLSSFLCFLVIFAESVSKSLAPVFSFSYPALIPSCALYPSPLFFLFPLFYYSWRFTFYVLNACLLLTYLPLKFSPSPHVSSPPSHIPLLVPPLSSFVFSLLRLPHHPVPASSPFSPLVFSAFLVFLSHERCLCKQEPTSSERKLQRLES